MTASAWYARSRGALLTLCLLLALAVAGWCHNEEEDTALAISLEGSTVKLSYLTRFPSMSSFVRLKQLDADANGQYSEAEKQVFLEKRLADYLARIEVTLNGAPVKLASPQREAKISGDAMGLSELSVAYTLVGELPAPIKPGDSLGVKDPAFGWNRYTVTTDNGSQAKVVEATVGDTMTVTFLGGGGGTSKISDNEPAALHGDDDRLMALVGSEMTPTVLLTTLGLAFVLGALHALTPGHGKTMVAAYLVGSRGTVSQAVLLGIVVTITHTASVFLLGLACMVAFEYVVPDKIIPWLGFVSGLLVTAVGGTLLIARLTGKEWGHGHSHDGAHGHSHSHSHKKPKKSAHSHSHSADKGHSHDHASPGGEHSHSHSHAHDHSSSAGVHGHSHAHEPHSHDHASAAGGHSHSHSAQVEPASGPVARNVPDAPSDVPEKISLWALVGLGISGGLVPCPEALVVLLSAISLNKLWLGMLVLVAFSLGLAALLVLIGILVVSATKMSKRYYPSDETIRKISIVSYVVICGMGLAIAIRSLVGGGIITINL